MIGERTYQEALANLVRHARPSFPGTPYRRALDVAASLLDAALMAGPKPHTTADCDEGCRGCVACYLRTGETICDKTCEHRELPEDQ